MVKAVAAADTAQEDSLLVRVAEAGADHALRLPPK